MSHTVHTVRACLACEQALQSRMGRKESAKRKVGWQALLGSLRPLISLGACSQARGRVAS